MVDYLLGKLVGLLITPLYCVVIFPIVYYKSRKNNRSIKEIYKEDIKELLRLIVGS